MDKEPTATGALTCKKEGTDAVTLTDTASGRAFAKILAAMGFAVYDAEGKPVQLNN